MKVSAETRQVIDWMLTEIGAGMCLLPKSEREQTWNDAHERCKAIIRNYRDGVGLIQMTAAAKRRAGGTVTTLLTPKQAARYLGMTLNGVWGAASAGRLQCQRKGANGRLLFRLADVKAYEKERQKRFEGRRR